MWKPDSLKSERIPYGAFSRSTKQSPTKENVGFFLIYLLLHWIQAINWHLLLFFFFYILLLLFNLFWPSSIKYLFQILSLISLSTCVLNGYGWDSEWVIMMVCERPTSLLLIRIPFIIKHPNYSTEPIPLH